jgi:GNAT superfamily N-acetyltransferase
MQIANIEQVDLKDLAHIYTAEYMRLDIGEKWTFEKAEVLLEHFLKAQPDLAFTAKEEEKPVGGFFGLIKPWWDGNHLVDFELFVDSNHHGKKVGKQLLAHAIRTAREKYQITSVDGATFNNFDFPFSWYKRIGFEIPGNLMMISADAKVVQKALE